MKRKEQEETVTQQKAMTKYDRKMEARKAQEEKDKRDAKLFKIGVYTVCAVLIIAIVSSIVFSITRKHNVLNGVYVTVGDENIAKVEYDYYFNSSVNNYANSYGSLLGLIGLDLNSDLDKQQYSDTMSWKDMFDQMTIEQLVETKAMVNAAVAAGFEYDATEEYAASIANIASEAETNGIKEADYYKSAFGTYATKENMEPIIKERLLASAYYNHLTEGNTPTAEEIGTYYSENKQSWDRTDYHIFTIEAQIPEEATQEQIDEAMNAAKEQAQSFIERREKGEEFEALCMEFAAEEQKVNYEDAESDYSLKVGTYYVGATSYYADWLYDDARVAGDMIAAEDTDSNKVYVVEFVSKYYAPEDDANISEEIAYNRTRKQIDALVSEYSFDGKGNVNLIAEEAVTEEAADEAPVEEEETAADETPVEEETTAE